jgi:hypothetical protein
VFFIKNTQIQNLVKIRQVGAELFHEDGDMAKLIVAFNNSEKGPQKCSSIFRLELSSPKLVHKTVLPTIFPLREMSHKNNSPYPEAPARMETNTVQLLITLNANWPKEHKQSVSNVPEITPVLPIAGQKYPSYFEGYLEFFTMFQNFYLEITRYVAQPLMKSRWSVVGQHWISHCHKASHDNWIYGIF